MATPLPGQPPWAAIRLLCGDARLKADVGAGQAATVELLLDLSHDLPSDRRRECNAQNDKGQGLLPVGHIRGSIQWRLLRVGR